MDIRNCMRMNFFLFHVVHRNKLQKKPFHKQTSSVTVHIVALVLLCFGQAESISRKILFTIALNSSEGCKAPACTGASAWAEERPSNETALFLIPRKLYKPQNFPVCQVKNDF